MDLAKYAIYARCLKGIDIPLLNPGSMFCLNEMQCPSKAKINPHRHRQRHLKLKVTKQAKFYFDHNECRPRKQQRG